MTVVEATSTKTSSGAARSGRLFLLDLSGGRVLSMDPDGSNRSLIAADCPHPDGVVVDVAAGHVYWTNMGAVPGRNDGSIERADIDGKNRRFIVPPGGTFTPKQLHLDKANGKLYWSDREGMRVMRSKSRRFADPNPRPDRDRAKMTAMTRPDGALESPSIPNKDRSTGRKKAGTTPESGRILRAGIDIPKGETAANRSDVEVFFERSSRADRSRARSRTSHPVLDRPRRSTARQHGEPRADRREARAKRAADRGLGPDGRYRHRAECCGQPHVRDRSSPVRFMPRSSTGRTSGCFSPPREISQASHTSRSDKRIGERI